MPLNNRDEELPIILEKIFLDGRKYGSRRVHKPDLLEKIVKSISKAEELIKTREETLIREAKLEMLDKLWADDSGTIYYGFDGTDLNLLISELTKQQEISNEA